MPYHGHKYLKQKAVLLAATGFDRYGEPTVAAPAQVSCRWEEKHSESVDAKGADIAIDCQVMIAQAVAVGSVMWKGTLVQWYSLNGSAGPDVDLFRVAFCNQVPDLKARHTTYSLGLQRFSGTQPGDT